MAGFGSGCHWCTKSGRLQSALTCRLLPAYSVWLAPARSRLMSTAVGCAFEPLQEETAFLVSGPTSATFNAERHTN